MAGSILNNQLIVLTLLDDSANPLTTAQIGDFFTAYNLAHYFTVQETLSDLHDHELIEAQTENNHTCYVLTARGRDSLLPYRDDLPEYIKAATHSYLKANHLLARRSRTTRAHFDHVTTGGYLCVLQSFEEDRRVFELSLTVPNQEMAETICHNWEQKNEDVHKHILDLLTN